MFEKELTELLKSEGAALAGFCSLESAPGAPFPFAVSVVVKLSDSILKTIDNAPTMPYFQHYRAVNYKLDSLALSAVKFIEDRGYKTAAVLSGLGYIGRNCLLITPEYGSKVRLATVLTDMPLSPLSERVPFSCGDCRICVNACPAGAVSGREYADGDAREDFFDAEKCSHYMKSFKDIGRGAVCGVCIKVCPKNRLT